MAGRTPQEILEQREAWMSRKAASAAGQDIPIQPPLKPGETAPEPVEAGATEVEAAETVETPEPVAAATAPTPEPETVAAPAPVSALPPQAPSGGKRTPEEIRAQREAFMAAKAARAAGQAPAPKPAAALAEAAPKPAAAPAAAKPAAAPKPATPAAAPAPRRDAPPAPEGIDPNITRRELLNHAWLASIGLFAVETVGLSLWFAFPNFKAGQFGGQFPLLGTASEVLPEVNAGPKPYTDGKFWLVNLDMESPSGEPRKGIMAIYKVCTHLGCLYEWVTITNRFECPCHGSKFALSADYLDGPARRSLDRFVIQAISPDGTVKETDAEGNPLEVNGDETLIIDTGQRILGQPVV